MKIFKEIVFSRGDIITIVSFVITALLLEYFGLFNTFESKTIDARFQLRGEVTPHPDLIMVDIADDAVEQFGQWPFPRHIHGMFIDAASKLGAKQVIYDIYFTKEGNRESDAFLGQMAKDANNCFFPIKFYPHEVPEGALVTGAKESVRPFSFADSPKDEELFTAQALLDVPLPAIVTSSKSMGFINTIHDIDGVSRRTPAVMSYDDRLYLQLCISAFVDYCKVDPQRIEFTPGKELRLPDAGSDNSGRDIVVPLDRDNNVIINWCGDWQSLPHYSFRDILLSYKLMMEGEEPILSREELAGFKDKVMIVGHVERGSHDYYPTPFSKQYYLPGLQFNLYNTLLSENYLKEIGIIGAFGIAILLIVLFTLLFSISPPWARPVLLIFFIIIFIITAQLLFNVYGLIIPVIRPLITLVALFAVLSFNRYLKEHEVHEHVKDAFKKYVAEDVMEQLLNQPEKLKPGGEIKNLTIFFSDIRGFTAMSERYSAEEVVSVLNEYLEAMTKVIFQFKGTIDKFVGDEIMAYFGAPLYPEDHQGRAIQAALTMQTALKKLQKRWAEENRPVLKIGIGINSGEVVIGNIGSEDYMDFTLIGDNVNISARLCSKALPGEILISETTYEAVQENVEVAMSRAIAVKGKEDPIKVFSIGHYRHDLQEEKRAFKRFDFTTPLPIHIIVGNVSFEAFLKDFSAGGCHIITTVNAEQGAPIQFSLFISKTMRRKKMIGRVISCKPHEDGQFRWRVNFSGQTENEQQELTRWVLALNENVK